MKKSNIIVFLGVIQIILFAMHLVVYEGLLSLFPDFFALHLFSVRLVFFILWISFVIASSLTAKYNNLLTRVFYRASAIWLGYMFYMFLALSVFGISVGVFGIFTDGAQLGEYGLALLLLALVASTYGLIHSNVIKVKEQIVELANLPEPWKTKKIVWISDVHLGQIRGEPYMSRVVRKINALNPDIVFIGGDLYDGVKVDEDEIISPLSKLATKFGAYFITGNHDGFSDTATSKDITAIEKTGIKVLRDQLINIEGVQIIGVDYKHAATREGYQVVLNSLNINRNIPSILLKHVPNDVDIAEQSGISLQISGHTHKAQVQPLSFIPDMVFKGFSYGLNRLNGLQVLVSSGVGTWGPPFRVGTHSEILSITLK